MEGSRDLEFHRLASSVFLGDGNREGDFRRLAGEHDLARAVEVGDIDVGRCGEFADAIFLAADYGGHAALGSLAGLLHGLRALCDEVQAGFKVKRPRCRVGRKLAKRKSRRGMKSEAGQFFLKDGETRQTMHIERRLTDRGLCQFVRRAFECGLGERKAENFVGPFEEVCGGGKFRSQILAHTDCLGALAGKQ